jgi:hypothetical protein
MEDAVLPQVAEGAPKYHIKLGFAERATTTSMAWSERSSAVVVRWWRRGSAKQTSGPCSPNDFQTSRLSKRKRKSLNEPSIQLVLSSQIPYERPPLGVRVMKQGKDFLADKPGITTLA